jgi:ribose/xylose/arabinose/galactoside ABC-type transport system permease subunit
MRLYEPHKITGGKRKVDKLNLGNVKKTVNRHMLEVILVLLIVLMSVTTSGFFTVSNLFNILRNMSFQGCIAFGMTLVIIAGEIDLSIGSTVALSGVITATVSGALARSDIMPMETAVVLGMLLAVVVAGFVGLFNGWLLTKFRMPSFIITLAMMNVLYGATAILAKGFPVITLPHWFSVLGAGRIGGIIPVPALILVLVFIINFVIVNYTKLGRAVYAVGGNADAARLSGINVKKVKMFVMIDVQICAALAGILVSSQVMAGSATFGRGWEMTAISSVIIGGASLSGGIGKVSRTFVGLIFLGVIINGMTLLNVNEYAQYVVRGGLILVAVLINTVQTQRKL